MTETQLKLAGTKRELSHIIVKCTDSAAGIRPGRFPDSVIGIWSLHLSALSLQLLQRTAPPVTLITGCGRMDSTIQALSPLVCRCSPKSQGDSHWSIPDQSLRWGGADADVYARTLLRVPQGRVGEYGFARVWERFGNVEEMA